MENNIVDLALETNDGTLRTPKMCLESCLKHEIGKEGAFKKGKKLFIVCLDDNDDLYNISWNQAGMKLSEMVSLLDITKGIIKEQILIDSGF